ncbi:MAG: hypothetical protein JXA43_03605 [Candidatus Diapherotrites archaeon]|nr:hypothetical protein [Candidatus Diapherotrites archaeon]
MKAKTGTILFFLGLAIGAVGVFLYYNGFEAIGTIPTKLTCPACEIPEASCLEGQAIPMLDRNYFMIADAALKNAQTTIDVMQFEVKYYDTYSDSNMNLIVSDLIEAHNRGVKVRVLVDEYSEENNAFDMLKAAGIEIKMDPENITTHNKLVIIDGQKVIIGSTNWSYYALDKNHESSVLIHSPLLASQMTEYFNDAWVES